MEHYEISLASCINVTAQSAEHLEANGWQADAPEYVYENVNIWDGGMGVLLLQDRATGEFYISE